MNGLADMPIEALHVSTGLVRLLRRARCRTVADVGSRWPEGILRVNRIGPVLTRVLYEQLRPLIPDLLPVPPSSRPLPQAIASARSTRVQQIRARQVDGIDMLRMFWSGMTAQQIAAQYRCSSSAVYARKRRLVLHYAQRPYLQRLPEGIQDFVLKESKKLLMTTRARHSRTGHAPADDLSMGQHARIRQERVPL